jgi:glutamate-ammonia-ligase adenylyltransferase
MSASAWAADYLTRRPLLLDELLDARVLLEEPDWHACRARPRSRAARRRRGGRYDALRH